MNRLTRTLLLLVLFFCVTSVMACTLGETAARTPAAASPEQATLTALITQTITATAVVSSSPAALITKEALNIRSGPGVQYPIIGNFASGAAARILGRSVDGLWWKIVCPAELKQDECWVIGDPLFVEAVNTLAIPVAAAPPPPTTVPTPSPTPCIVAQPDGWNAYTVQSGDTLYDIALQNGVSMADLKAVNCLESEIVVIQTTLFVPGEIVSSPGGSAPLIVPPPPTPPQRDGQRLTAADAERLGIVAALADGLPNNRPCPTTSTTPRLHIGESRFVEQRTWAVAQQFYICAIGFVSEGTPRVTVTSAQGDTAIPDYDELLKAWRWTVLPNAFYGVYTVTAQLDTVVAPAKTFTITPASRANILVLTKTVAANTVVRAALAGLATQQALYLYQYDAQVSARPYKLFWQLAPPRLNANGEGYLEFLILASDPKTVYVIASGQLDEDVRGANDPRVFTVE